MPVNWQQAVKNVLVLFLIIFHGYQKAIARVYSGKIKGWIELSSGKILSSLHLPAGELVSFCRICFAVTI